MNAATLPAAELAAHRPQLLKFALLHLRNRAHAEDAVQDTLLAALEGARRFAGESSLRTWLIGILRHKIIDQFRRETREPQLAPRAGEGAQDEGAEAIERLFRADGHWQSPPQHWNDPEAACSRAELAEAIERGLARLPEKTARAFRMREGQGMSTDEICRVLGVTRENCWIMLYRARMSLRECLEGHWKLS